LKIDPLNTIKHCSDYINAPRYHEMVYDVRKGMMRVSPVLGFATMPWFMGWVEIPVPVLLCSRLSCPES